MIFLVDHQALLHMVKKLDLSRKMVGWVLLLQEFDYTIIHTPSRIHMVTDYLSRLENGEKPTESLDEFLDANLF